MKKNIIVYIIALLLISTIFISTVNANAVEYTKPKEFYSDLQNLKDAMKDAFQTMMKYAKQHNATEYHVLWNPNEFFVNTREIMNLALVLFGHNPIGILIGAICIFSVCWIPFRMISYIEAHNEFIEQFSDGLQEDCEQLIHVFGVIGFFICFCIALPLVIPLYFGVVGINARWYTIDAIVWCIQDAIQYCS